MKVVTRGLERERERDLLATDDAAAVEARLPPPTDRRAAGRPRPGVAVCASSGASEAVAASVAAAVELTARGEGGWGDGRRMGIGDTAVRPRVGDAAAGPSLKALMLCDSSLKDTM